MKIIKFILLFIVVLIMNFCDFYESEYPLCSSKSSIITDDSILGQWFIVTDEKEFKNVIGSVNLLKWDSLEYIATTQFYNFKKDFIDEVENYKLFICEENFDNYINMQKIDDKAIRSYLILRYEIFQSDSAVISFLNEDFSLEFNSSQDFAKYALENRDEFQEYFRDSLLLKRQHTLNWEYLNNHSISKISSFRIITEDITEQYFRKINLDSISNLSSKEFDIDIFRKEWKNYSYNPASNLSYKVKPTFAYFVHKNRIYKLLINKNSNSILDLSRNMLYIQNQHYNWIDK